MLSRGWRIAHHGSRRREQGLCIVFFGGGGGGGGVRGLNKYLGKCESGYHSFIGLYYN